MSDTVEWLGKKVTVQVDGVTRPGEITGVAHSPSNLDYPARFKVRFTDVPLPDVLLVINNVEYPEGLSAYFDAQEVSFVD